MPVGSSSSVHLNSHRKTHSWFCRCAMLKCRNKFNLGDGSCMVFWDKQD